MLRYTIDENAEEPIMLIDTHIGYDENDGMGIDGSAFAKELMFLDSLGKKRVQVWICSEGGSVMEGMKIYTAILKSKCKVDTYCTGIAASIAAVIFQAGRTRYMMDFALLMFHDASGGENEKELDPINASIATMISGRTGKTVEEIREVMAPTTWINSTDSKTFGMCDEVEPCSDFNKPRLKVADGPTAMWKQSLTYMNSIKPKPVQINIEMKKVTNRLKLNEAANEDQILAAIDSIDSARETAIQATNALKTELKNKDEEVTKLKNQVLEFEKAKKDAEEKTAAEKAEAEGKEADTILAKGVELGKIENKAEVIKKWKDQFTANFASTKDLFELLPGTKKIAPDFKNKIEKDENGNHVFPYTIAGRMAEITNKNKVKAA